MRQVDWFARTPVVPLLQMGGRSRRKVLTDIRFRRHSVLWHCETHDLRPNEAIGVVLPAGARGVFIDGSAHATHGCGFRSRQRIWGKRDRQRWPRARNRRARHRGIGQRRHSGDWWPCQRNRWRGHRRRRGNKQRRTRKRERGFGRLWRRGWSHLWIRRWRRRRCSPRHLLTGDDPRRLRSAKRLSLGFHGSPQLLLRRARMLRSVQSMRRRQPGSVHCRDRDGLRRGDAVLRKSVRRWVHGDVLRRLRAKQRLRTHGLHCVRGCSVYAAASVRASGARRDLPDARRGPVSFGHIGHRCTSVLLASGQADVRDDRSRMQRHLGDLRVLQRGSLRPAPNERLRRLYHSRTGHSVSRRLRRRDRRSGG